MARSRESRSIMAAGFGGSRAHILQAIGSGAAEQSISAGERGSIRDSTAWLPSRPGDGPGQGSRYWSDPGLSDASGLS